MATVEKRQRRTDGPVTYRVRYRDPSGRQRSKTFDRVVDARQFAKAIDTDITRGDYIDPAARRITFGTYARQWADSRVRRDSSAASLEHALRRMAELHDMRLAAIRRSDIQAWVQRQAQTLAPTTLRTTYREMSSIFRAAVDDGIINRSPCGRIALPQPAHGQIVPITAAQVEAWVQHTPDRYKALIVASAGLGLRQGEALGLTVDRINFLRRSVRIDRQMLTPAKGAPRFGPPKTPASARTIPLPATVANTLAAHLERHGAGTDGLVFTSPAGSALRRNNTADMLRRAVIAAGLPDGTSSHDLRHFYASLLIAQGQSVKVVQSRLGHRSAVETLDTYGHLWPDSEEDTIAAVDDVLDFAMRL